MRHTGLLLLTFVAGVTGCDRAGPSPLSAPSRPAPQQTPQPTRSSLETDDVPNVALIAISISSTRAAANCEEPEWARSSTPPARIIAGTVVNGNIDPGMLATAIEVLPHRPERIVVVNTKDLPLTREPQLRGLDAFVLCGSSVIYLRRQSEILRAAEYSGGPYVLILAVIIWHEMAHTEGLDERQAQQREEALWVEFMRRRLVDTGIGLTYLADLRRRPPPGASRHR